jgi:predicted transposase/invertase (TIGR01784 family)
MEKILNPHDRLFKDVLSRKDAARDFLSNYLPPDLLDHIDLDTLEILKDSFVQDDLKEYFSDLLYKVSISGRSSYVYLLFEHKSHPEKRVSLQLLSYLQRIWELQIRQQGMPLSVVIPIVFYHGREKWTSENDLLHLFALPDGSFSGYVPDFRYILFDLSLYPDEAIKGAVFNRVTLLLLKHVFDADFTERLPVIFSLLGELLEKETGMEYLETVIRYVFRTTENITAEKLKKIVETSLSEGKGEAVMTTLAEKYIEEGFQKGIQQGIQQGILEGLLEGIELGIGLKFGAQGVNLMPAIRQIKDPERLKAIKEAVKVAKSIEEIRQVISG